MQEFLSRHSLSSIDDCCELSLKEFDDYLSPVGRGNVPEQGRPSPNDKDDEDNEDDIDMQCHKNKK